MNKLPNNIEFQQPRMFQLSAGASSFFRTFSPAIIQANEGTRTTSADFRRDPAVSGPIPGFSALRAVFDRMEQALQPDRHPKSRTNPNQAFPGFAQLPARDGRFIHGARGRCRIGRWISGYSSKNCLPGNQAYFGRVRGEKSRFLPPCRQGAGNARRGNRSGEGGGYWP